MPAVFSNSMIAVPSNSVVGTDEEEAQRVLVVIDMVANLVHKRWTSKPQSHI